MPTPRGLIQQIDQELHRTLLLPRRASLLVAVSAGADSVALLRILHAINQSDFWRWTLIVAHVDHGIRGKASAADARFVNNLAASLKLPCMSRKLSLGKHATESAARNARLRALASMATSQRCDAVVMAHHADDQAETVLLRLFRGCGIDGIAGISPDTTVGRLRILRPLLSIRRYQLREYLRSICQGFREDRTNTQDRYTRNRLRNHLLPKIESFAPSATLAVTRLASIARMAQRLIDAHLHALRTSSLILQTPRQVRFRRDRLNTADPLLLTELLRQAVAQLGGSSESADFERLQQASQQIQSTPGSDPKIIELGRGIQLHITKAAVTLTKEGGRRR